MMSRIICFSLLGLVVSLAGCGGGGATGGVPVYSVTGTVTMAGAPLGDATVAFAPLDGQPTAIGTTDEDGTFKLTTYTYGDGAAEGKYKVLVSKTIMPNGGGGGDDDEHGDDYESGSEHAGGGTAGGGTSMVPPSYNSKEDTPFEAAVTKDGDNNFEFKVQ